MSAALIHAPARALRRLAFTLFELLVVIVVVLALIAVTLPSFGALIESASFSSAVNAVTGTLGNARALAISSGKAVGVAFLFDVQTRIYTLQVVELARAGTKATLTDAPYDADGAAAWGLRPAQNTTPVRLPDGMGVFGLSFVHDPEPQWTQRIPVEPPTASWYAGETFIDPARANWRVNPWLFPRNDPRLFLDPDDLGPVRRVQGMTLDEVWRIIHGESIPGVNVDPADAALAVRHANSFLVLFDANGMIVTVYDGGATTPERNFYLEFPDDPIDTADSAGERPDPYDREFIFDPEFAPGNIDEPAPNPEVWLRSVSQLAVVSFARLVAGAQVDRVWELHPSTSQAPWPDFRGAAQFASNPLSSDDPDLDDLVNDVSRWIDLNAEVIGFDRYTGAAQRRSGLQ